MKDRIKLIRKTANLTQEEFAIRLGGKRNTVAKYETGAIEPSTAVFSLICREFGVNENWLRTGEGEMYTKTSRDDDIQRFVDSLKVEGDSFKKRLISVLSDLDSAGWKVLEEIAASLYREEQAREANEEEKEIDIEKEVERYRQQLIQEQEAARRARGPYRTG